MLNTAETMMSNEMQAITIRQDIFARLETMSLDSLKMLQNFAIFLQQYMQPKTEESITPDEPDTLEIVPVPVSKVLKLAGAVGYEGNALLDSEANYDEI